MQSAGKQFCEQSAEEQVMDAENKEAKHLEILHESAQGCGYFPETQRAYEALKCELVNKDYKLRDAMLLAAAYQPCTQWSTIDQDLYLAMAEAAWNKLSADSTIEPFSTVGFSTVKESLTVHPDDAAIDLFAAAMKAKMKYSREVKGRSGWDDPTVCSMDNLHLMFWEHIEKGDVVDIANFAMMIWNRIYCICRERG